MPASRASCDHRRVVGRDEIGQHLRTAGRRPALGTKDILLGDGNAGQRAGRTGCDAGIGGTRHGQRLLAVDGDEGVDIGIQALDAVENSVDSSTLEICLAARACASSFRLVDHSITFGTR
jgi:hypothetical protein